jgi:cobalt-zinc-cadmium resistance protein CzcA
MMINRIIEFVLRQHLLIVAMTIVIAAIGFYSLNNILIYAFPDVTNVQVQVIAKAPGLPPVEAENLVVKGSFFLKPKLAQGIHSEEH